MRVEQTYLSKKDTCCWNGLLAREEVELFLLDTCFGIINPSLNPSNGYRRIAKKVAQSGRA